MKSGIKQIIKIVISAVITMITCVLLITFTALIPRDLLKENTLKSADYISEKGLFPLLIGDKINSVQDNYSDCCILDIIYCMDPAHPFRSAMLAEYVQQRGEKMADGLKSAVAGVEPNVEYGRYWHGTSVLLTPMLIFMPIQTIRIVFGILGTIFLLLSCGIVFKRGNKAFAVCMILAFLLVEPWMFFLSLEYSTAFLTSTVASFFLLIKKDRSDEKAMPFFAAVGVVIFFVDFLTTETLTFLLPMLLLLAERAVSEDSEKDTKKGILSGCFSVIKNGACWFAGYAGMFALKIIILVSMADNDVVSASISEGFFRLGGETRLGNTNLAPEASLFVKLSGAIWHNLACLFPVDSGLMLPHSAWIPTIIILAIGFALVYLFHDKIDHKVFVPMAMIAILPFLRFLVLANHSYIHFFITYRVMMVTIAVFLYYIYENSVHSFIRRKKQ